MQFINRLRQRAKNRKKHIVFPESSDSRILTAAEWLLDNSICRVTLLGNYDEILAGNDECDIVIPKECFYSDNRMETERELFADHYLDLRKKDGMTPEDALQAMADPLYFGAAMVAWGNADACVAGAVHTTGDVLRAAIKVIGLPPENQIVSSVFLMVLPDNRVMTYGDCGVVPYPDAAQLADIAIQSSKTHKLLCEQEPVTAMLSFSTKGSAEHERVKLVRDALELVRNREPDLIIDGEFQFDTAYVPEVAGRKAPDSKVAGNASVFIFPNLDAGNIAYKITERLGGASATGPIIQGLAKPMMDLSRGCKWEDIVNAVCVAILMGE